MKKLAIFVCCIMLISSIAFAQGPVAGTEPSAGAKIADCVIVRPLCAAGSVVSTAVFIVLSPALYIFGVGEPAARVMVEAPWRYTGARTLGDFSGQQTVDGEPITTIE